MAEQLGFGLEIPPGVRVRIPSVVLHPRYPAARRNSPAATHTAGLIDNIVMIQAGDLIDNAIGVTLSLSTTAAAYGQVVSDTAGTLFGNAIDAFFAPRALAAQPEPAARGLQGALVGTLSATAGVICGCLLGMTSLLLMDLEKGGG